MPPRTPTVSQFLVEVLDHFKLSDSEKAKLLGVTDESIRNWRKGTEISAGRLDAELLARFTGLLKTWNAPETTTVAPLDKLIPIEIHQGCNPSDVLKRLETTFQNKLEVPQALLYFQPEGASAWSNILKTDYTQREWIAGVEACLDDWLGPPTSKASSPKKHGSLVDALRKADAVDYIALGVGDGEKESLVAERLIALTNDFSYVPVDISIPLLCLAVERSRDRMARLRHPQHRGHLVLRPICADIEDGEARVGETLGAAVDRPGASRKTVRIVSLLGNTFANLRREEPFMMRTVAPLVRKGDYLWLEVSLRPKNLEDDPLYPPKTVSVARKEFILGPMKNWMRRVGRAIEEIGVSIEKDDGGLSDVESAVSFAHYAKSDTDTQGVQVLIIRRYDLDALLAWMERRGYRHVASRTVKGGRVSVAHVLLEKT